MSGWVSPTHPAPSPIPLGALGGGDGGGKVGWGEWAPPAEWMVLCRGVELWAEAHVLLERSFAHPFLKRVALVLRSRVPLPLPVVELVPISLGGATKMGGYGFSPQAPCTGQDSVSWQIPSKSTCCWLFSLLFAHLCWFEANMGPEAVFGTITHLFQFSLADTVQCFLRHPPTLIIWWPSW